ncbi:gliding motility-associated-like protein [Flavobacteriaceae bacterium MAR_2010_72]|nr:gliding motility-associated-like protein [Flavobacteriaceae bacterium MAR_2010_72]TVZ57561.1 gliding motility-associated-like protein [Flavobacteriaceae bacterium MAR_2010_105]
MYMAIKKSLLICFLFCTVFGFSQDITMQNGTFTQCSGMFYDSGGANNDYANNESFEITICPDSAGQKLQLNFTTFNIAGDVMQIYNGDTTAAPGLGNFSGTNSPALISATSTNSTGCITIQFFSDLTTPSTGWAANILCYLPCQTITSQLDTATPAPDSNGYIRVCPNETIDLTGSGMFSDDGAGATYEWDLGDGRTISGQTANFSYPNPGVYKVNLNIRDTNTSVDPQGCRNTNLINQVIQVGNPPDFAGTQAADTIICFGDTTTIEGVVTPVTYVEDCAPPISGTTFLPDGTGAQYFTCITVDCYASGQTLTDISQLLEVCVNMEHSYSGDLIITLISPDGREADLFTQPPGVAAANYFGNPLKDDTMVPGTGADYCFSMAASTLLENGATISAGTPAAPSWAPGTYLPKESFSNLVGSPLNGQWCLRIIDNLPIDSGYIFSWGMNFDPSVLPADLTFTPVITSEAWDTDSSITNTSGNTITVQPATAGTHCYTYRVVDDFGCEYTEQVCIDVLPEIITAPANDLFACDMGSPHNFDLTENTPVVISSAPNPSELVITYHQNLADADSGSNSISSASNYSGADGQTIYTRIEYQTSGCYEIETFTLNLTNPPTINAVPDLMTCDDSSNDGFEPFNLELQTLGILGAQPASDFNVTYHANFSEADGGTNALTSPFTNTVNPQGIFVRVERAGEPSCYSVSAAPLFSLIVNYRAVANTPSNLEVCDDISNDGFAQFDLTVQDLTILGTQDPSLFTISYYENSIDADTATNQIPNPTTYINSSSPQTIFARIEENANPICYSTTFFDIIVYALPTVVSPTLLETCDDTTADGMTEFDLTLKDNEITAGNPNLVVSYYESNADAQSQSNVITNPTAYTNRSVNGLPANPQTLYVVVTNVTTNCISYTTLELQVLPNPTPNDDANDLVACDDVNPGNMQEVFNLTTNETYILNGQVGVSASYFTTQTDAEGNINAIATPTAYQNSVNPQTIFVRVSDDVTGCFTVVDFDLLVEPLPVATAMTALVVCQDNSTGFYAFDLESKTAEALNGQDPMQFSVTYHQSQADADSLMNPLASPFTNTSNPQQIFVAITNTSTGCSISTPSFFVEVQEIPEANGDAQSIRYAICDNIGDNDGFAQFDLTTQDIVVLDGQDPSDFSVTYFSSMTNADGNINPLPTVYENSTNPQVIYARVDDNTTADAICYAITPLTLEVNLRPIFDLEDNYVLCVNTNGTEVIAPPLLDTGLPVSDYSFEWSYNAVVIPTETSPSLIPTMPGTYSVLVTNNTSGCQASDSAEVEQSEPPVVTANVTSNAFADNHVVVVTAVGSGDYEFSLGNGPWQDSNTFENAPFGEHVVSARDKIGCGFSSTTITVVDYPLFFTPNGDNFNDTWNIKGLENQNNVTIYIYDRYGKLLKQISASGDGWNGTYNGALMPSNDYWFTVLYDDLITGARKEFSAHFALKR